MLFDLPDSRQLPRWLRYALALAIIAFALALRWPLEAWLGQSRYVTVFGGVAVAVWMLRWKPATIAALAGFVAVQLVIVPPQLRIVFDATLLAELAGYAVSAGLMIFFGEAMHRARERAEAAQRTSSEQQQLLSVTLASIGDGVVATDGEGRVTFLNAEAARLTGWSSDEAKGRPLPEVFRILNERTRQPFENPVEKVIRTGGVVGLANHTVLVARDGSETPIDDSAAPIRSADGPLQGVVFVFRDVTAQRAAEFVRNQLAAVVEFSGDAIFTKDLDGKVQTWNAGAERFFGYRAEEIVGRPVTVLFPSDRIAEDEMITSRIREGKPSEIIETVRVRKDGRHIPVLLSVSPIKDADGNVVGASKVLHDISELVAMRRLLEKDGHSVITAGTVNEALAHAERHECDLVISDLGLPDGSGCDLMAALRRRCDWPAIALSGYGMDADLRRSAEAGFATHLVKPVDIGQLREAIVAALRRE